MTNTKSHIHTPTPWKVHCDKYICDPKGATSMEPRILMGPTHEMDRDCNSEEASANAEFIVRACNAHDDLVAVAEKAKAAFSYLSINGPKDLREEFAKRFRETELALAKVKAVQ